MEHLEKAKACLAWLNEKYNLSSLSIADIIDLTIEWNNNDAMKYAAQYYQMQQERKKEEEEKTKSRIDFNEEIDENGHIWYKYTHLYKQREESRQLKSGDIIKYKTTCPGGVYEEGIMIVNSFDYEI